MKGRLFLFCIGGTGMRVLRSLIFLLASGTQIKARQIIPIIIDADTENGDVARTLRLLKYYNAIRKSGHTQHSSFFYTAIESLKSIDGDLGQEAPDFESFLEYLAPKTQAQSFANFLQYDYLDKDTQALLSLLYEDKQLSSDLSVGFRGQPQMGSVVLNDLPQSKVFEAFIHALKADDRIFMVHSVFGGTGASGFPLLLKNIKEKNYPQQQAIIDKVAVGALCVLPYFGVKSDKNSAIDKHSFMRKTKAALQHYEKSIKSLNVLYYIGDTTHKDYDNIEGAANQKNKAHFIEIASALSIVDFMELDIKQNTPIIHKEFGIQDDYSMPIDFKSLGPKSKLAIAQPLVQFYYSIQHWKYQLSKSIQHNSVVYIHGHREGSSAKILPSFLSSDFYKGALKPFYTEFEIWLKELSENERSFMPYDFNAKQLNHMIKNILQKPMGLLFKSDKWDYLDFDTALDRVEPQTKNMTVEQKFLALYSLATADIYNQRITEAMF